MPAAGTEEMTHSVTPQLSRYQTVSASKRLDVPFGRPICEVASSLQREVVTDARERVSARDLNASIEELLVELSTWHETVRRTSQSASSC